MDQLTTSLLVLNISLSLSNTSKINSFITLVAGQMSEVYAIKEGGELDLSCPIRSSVQNEDMIISWTCDNEPANIRSSRVHVTESGKLRIRSAKVGDSCNYRCEAADGFGTLSSIIKVIIVEKRMINSLSRYNQSLPTSRSIQQEMAAQRSALANAEPANGANGVSSLPDNGFPATKLSNEHEQQPSDLEVSINPPSVHVDKNRTFNLECRVKYAAHQRPPQIIWLKQFIGQKPSSPSEALEQNLIIIDNIYYHSLNWPRSITYSRNSACANSALLIRQSNYVHSGKYICFAGYPPYSMSTVNLSSNPQEGSILAGRPLKYRMATALVSVDDAAGEASHMLSLDWAGAPGSWRNLISSFFSTNHWLENLILILVFTCGLVYTIKFIYGRYKLYAKKRDIGASVESGPTVAARANQEIQADSLPPLAIKQVQHLQLIDPASFDTEKQNSSDLSQSLQQAFSIEDQLLKSDPRQTNVDEHLYSEIGEKDKANPNAYSDYKVPNRVDRLDI